MIYKLDIRFRVFNSRLLDVSCIRSGQAARAGRPGAAAAEEIRSSPRQSDSRQPTGRRVSFLAQGIRVLVQGLPRQARAGGWTGYFTLLQRRGRCLGLLSRAGETGSKVGWGWPGPGGLGGQARPNHPCNSESGLPKSLSQHSFRQTGWLAFPVSRPSPTKAGSLL